MQLSGSHNINGDAEKIWNMLLDPVILAKITPTVSKLELIEEDSYKAIAIVKIGPVSGSFSGNIEVADKVPPASFTLKIKQLSPIGNVAADIKMKLHSINEKETEVSFDGDAKLSGVLARTGQRVIGAVANALSKQFFVALQKEMEEENQNPEN